MRGRLVWKYPMEDGRVTVSAPSESKVALFAFQSGVPTVWIDRPVIEDLEPVMTNWEFQAVGTGADTGPGDWRHVASTAVGRDAFYVFHLYERRLV